MSPRIDLDRDLTPAEQSTLWCIRMAEGELTAARQAEFAAWLTADPLNRRLFEEAVATWRDFDGAESAQEFLQIREHALRHARGSRWRWSEWRVQIAAAAAALVLVAAGGGLWAWRSEPIVYHTGVGERRIAVLDDGSRISLDAQTTVRVRYTGARRELELVDGRAKFDVVKDPLRPFSVAAKDKVVVATGTEFSVELVQKQIHVVLYEGHVAVLEDVRWKRTPKPVRLRGTSVPADQTLTPGRELVVSDASGEVRVTPNDPARSLAWEAGQLVFAEEPLSSAVEEVNRYSAEQLRIGDAVAGQVLISGVFNAGDVQAFIDGVSAAFPVQIVSRDGARVFVSKKTPA